MSRLPAWADRWWWRWFGGYTIDDPRPIASAAPYTYYLPSENELLALAAGDLAQLIFRSVPAGRRYDAERMWVKITACDGERLAGALENTPHDMPQLRVGAMISFLRSDVIGIVWDEERTVPPPASPPHREYRERCLVDACVAEAGVPVHYLYREEPDMTEAGDSYPDSGWRIRGDYRDLSDEEFEQRALEYVALGRVLNADDSWVHLIDAPVGSAFIRDWETGAFVPVQED